MILNMKIDFLNMKLSFSTVCKDGVNARKKLGFFHIIERGGLENCWQRIVNMIKIPYVVRFFLGQEQKSAKKVYLTFCFYPPKKLSVWP